MNLKHFVEIFISKGGSNINDFLHRNISINCSILFTY